MRIRKWWPGKQETRLESRRDDKARRERGRGDARGVESPELRDLVLLALILSALAAGLDLSTGPALRFAAFYAFPVSVAAWRYGRLAGLMAAAVATTLDVGTAHVVQGAPVTFYLTTGAVMRMVLFVSVAMFSSAMGRQHASLVEQTNRLESLNQRLNSEMEAARAIQRLLFSRIPDHPMIDIGQWMQPARVLGGDIAQVIIGPDETLALAIGDVSGKGNPAALAGAVLLGLMQDAPERFLSPSRTLDYLSKRLAGCLPGEMFVTLFYGLLSLKTGRMVYANAGHEHPLIVGATGNCTELESTGVPLAIAWGKGYEDRETSLAPGDLLVCFSDGLVDLRKPGGERLTREALQDIIVCNAGIGCRDFVRKVVEDALAGTDEAIDDVTVLALRYGPGPVQPR